MDLTCTIIMGGTAVCTPQNWTRPGEWEDAAKLYAPVCGEAWLSVHGQQTVLRPKHFYLIPPHAWLAHAAPRRMVVHWLHFRANSPWIDTRLARIGRVLPMPTDIARRWWSIFAAFSRTPRNPPPALACRVHAMLLDSVGVALEQAPSQSSATELLHERLEPALRYMDEHVGEALALHQIATTVQMSPEHFHRLFRKLLQTTPHAYLLQRRMAKARRLLAEGALRVGQVARACGYADPFYFSRVFRKHFGYTAQDVLRQKVTVGP